MTLVIPQGNQIEYRSEIITITSGNTTSSSVDLAGMTLQIIRLPAAFTGSTITFQSSNDNITFQSLYDVSNTQLSMNCTQGRDYKMFPGDFYGVRYLKLVSGSAEGADRTILLFTRVSA